MQDTVYVIDTYAQIFRAFYSIRTEMKSRAGAPVNAVFGFASMLFRLLNEHKPAYVIAALDDDDATFRDHLYDKYKATRQPTPPDLKAQVPLIVDLCGALGIPVIASPGLEADDIIASVVRHARAYSGRGRLRVRIVSRDKDLEQLLCDQVSLYDVHTGMETTPQSLWDLKGIRPEQVADYLAMTGDLVDNIPGVAGIGPKTATLLLQEFGSLREIRANCGAFADRRRDAFLAAEALMPIVTDLVTLRDDPSIQVDWEAARVSPFDLPTAVSFFRDCGFWRHQDQARRLHEELSTPSAVVSTRSRQSSPPAQFAFDFG